jgi:hypothetical protein
MIGRLRRADLNGAQALFKEDRNFAKIAGMAGAFIALVYLEYNCFSTGRRIVWFAHQVK